MKKYQGDMEFYEQDRGVPGIGAFTSLFFAYRNDTLHMGYMNNPFNIGDTIRLLTTLANDPAIGAIPSIGIGYAMIAREDVTTPAGTFEDCCLHRYQGSPNGFITDYWYKHGVGVVKIVENDYGNIRRWELRSYTLK